MDNWDFGFFIRLVVIATIVIISCFLGIDYYRNNYYDKDMVHTYTRIQEVQAIQYNGHNIGMIIDLVGLNNVEVRLGKLSIEDPEYGSIEVQLGYYIVKDKENNLNIYPKEYFESNFKLIH